MNPANFMPRLYQHDDGRYGLSFGPAKFAVCEPAWHSVPIDVIDYDVVGTFAMGIVNAVLVEIELRK
jgi:hypothetical protein